jgi:hypothetical protein
MHSRTLSMVLVKVLILFSASMPTLSILSETTLSEIIFEFNSSWVAAFADSDLAMRLSANF